MKGRALGRNGGKGLLEGMHEGGNRRGRGGENRCGKGGGSTQNFGSQFWLKSCHENFILRFRVKSVLRVL